MNSPLAAAIADHRRGLVREAEAQYRRLLAADPGCAEAHNALGIALQQQGKPAEAAGCFRRAVAIKPDYVGAHGNLGAALKTLGWLDQAVVALEQALALDSGNAESHYNLACAYQEGGQFEQAIAGYRRTVALTPNHSGAYNNLGIIFKSLGRLDEAMAAYARSIACAPDNPVVRYNHAQALLESGDFKRGWAEHEWRFAAGIALARHSELPRWQGEALTGRTILVWSEQGLGDTIQFCRYLPLLSHRDAKVIFEVQPQLERLCRSSLADITVVARGQPLPDCDFQVPLMSLPGLMVETPAATAYLHPIADEARAWGATLGPRLRPRIGLVWAGSPTHKDDRNRSVPVESLRPMTELTGAEFYSFQVGPAANGQITGVTDLSSRFDDFAATAAALGHMDLLIAVDTAVLHLAGALGRPAWALLPFAPDWRWLRHRDDSPWYPSLRLFRQERRQDWESVIARVIGQLRVFIASG
ncbi:MAG: tetratricopeptide repeat-containing glycosyltransferase family protein [Phaeospirillum sp.]|nr:tetratricopeptide repeat-containing glycosyltransferase family protein [Phaeospirillum sp.]